MNYACDNSLKLGESERLLHECDDELPGEKYFELPTNRKISTNFNRSSDSELNFMNY